MPISILKLLYFVILIITSATSNASDKTISNTNEMLKSYLKLSAFKHKVLANNIANLNTPNYRADDVAMPQKYSDFKNIMAHNTQKLKLQKTSGKHLAGRYDTSDDFKREKLKDPEEEKLNGNNVSLSQQMTKISENQINYDTALKSYSSMNSLVAAAMGR